MALSSTLYEYYTAGGVATGLSTNQTYFTLNERNITLYSGAMHYFRVPKQYWRDRLRKMKAAGLNTVETYVPWNLHEPKTGQFDFGDGGSDFQDFLDVEGFVKMAQEEDLLVIVRPGPYICAEWEFGGLPSWLLREKDIKVRTSDDRFMTLVARYFARLLPILAALQFTNGGPIVAFQVENEYGSTRSPKDHFMPDKQYIRELRNLFLYHNITELLFTSDAPVPFGDDGTLPELFQTANFAKDYKLQFDKLKLLQRNRPTMATEFWTGWFDHWSEQHHLRSNVEFRQVLEGILKYPASVNLYMFHGGTNWGFLNGANIDSDTGRYQPDTTSYDYDAPLAENGDYTEKYHIVRELLQKYGNNKTPLPPLPEEIPRTVYPEIRIQQQLQYAAIVNNLSQVFYSEEVVPMELLPCNDDSGQSYGYTIYRTRVNITRNSVLKFNGYIHDSVLVLVDGVLISSPLKGNDDLKKFGYWLLKDGSIVLPEKQNAALDIITTNWGRNNYGKLKQLRQFKGLQDSVYLNDVELKNFEIRPWEFKTEWIRYLSGWGSFSTNNVTLNKVAFDIQDPLDTYVDMSKWNTGIVIVNGFVLGRYMHLGPQQALYLPAPLLRKGTNEIVIFEHFTPHTHVSFSKNPIYLKK